MKHDHSSPAAWGRQPGTASLGSRSISAAAQHGCIAAKCCRRSLAACATHGWSCRVKGARLKGVSTRLQFAFQFGRCRLSHFKYSAILYFPLHLSFNLCIFNTFSSLVTIVSMLISPQAMALFQCPVCNDCLVLTSVHHLPYTSRQKPYICQPLHTVKLQEEWAHNSSPRAFYLLLQQYVMFLKCILHTQTKQAPQLAYWMLFGVIAFPCHNSLKNRIRHFWWAAAHPGGSTHTSASAS